MVRRVVLQDAIVGDIRAGERVRLQRDEPTSEVRGAVPATWNGQPGVRLTLHQPGHLPSGGASTEVWEVFLLREDRLLRVIDAGSR